jgi:hypothetical protein
MLRTPFALWHKYFARVMLTSQHVPLVLQVKALKGPDIVGLGMGGLAPGELPAAKPEQRLPAPVRPLELEAPDAEHGASDDDVQEQAELVHVSCCRTGL